MTDSCWTCEESVMTTSNPEAARLPLGASEPLGGLGGVPTIDADPFGHDILEDPSEFHEQLRGAGRVVYLSRYDVFAMGRYADVRAALVDWQSFQSAAGVGLSNFKYEKPWRPPSLLLESDPPHHDAPRVVLSSILSVRALRKLRDGWMADAEQLVGDLAERATGKVLEIDGYADLAAAFPIRVFPDAVGIGKEGRENLLPYGDHLFNAFGPSNDLVQKGADRIGDISTWVIAQCARDALTAGGFGEAIWAAADRGDITHEQAPLIVRSLLSAGVDTTVHGIAAVLHAFASHPHEWDALRGDRDRIRVAFDEAVRWESPVQTFFRTATTDVRIGDVTIPEGRKILMFLGAANRDPRRWDNPDVYDLARDPSGHVGFGMGIHQCVGQHVARLEAEALLHALLDRVCRIEIAETPERHHNNTLRAWKSIPLRFHLS
ncbi:cytochrome P450 [Streptomyces sp. NPDC001351]|uniref:cytochrome P450 n=1 Tax=unclassified Streptomyces TaxID=2593676 RepID=UPI0036AE0262